MSDAKIMPMSAKRVFCWWCAMTFLGGAAALLGGGDVAAVLLGIGCAIIVAVVEG